MAERTSKVALRRASELLGTDRPAARGYLRRIQARLGRAVPYADIVATMEMIGLDEDIVVAELGRPSPAPGSADPH